MENAIKNDALGAFLRAVSRHVGQSAARNGCFVIDLQRVIRFGLSSFSLLAFFFKLVLYRK